jgi:tetratricopeptide (TPR) repeat protein
VAEKVAAALDYKREGNEAFKAGDLKGAKKSYLRVFLYLNGLITADAPMRGFFSAMGAENAKFGDNETEGASQDDVIKGLKLETNNNLSLVFHKLENYEKALKHANNALALDKRNMKALLRCANAMSSLKQFEAALATLATAASVDPESNDVKRQTAAITKLKKAADKEQNEKDRNLFANAFKSK